MFHFVRSVGSSYFISASFVLAFHTSKMSYSNLVQWVTPFNEFFRSPFATGVWDLGNRAELQQLSEEVARQAVTIGFLNAFHLFTWASLLVYPLIALVRWPAKRTA